MFKVYIDDNGKFYKVAGDEEHPPQPKSSSHAERSLVTQEFLQVLPNDGTGMFMVDIDEAVRQILAKRTEVSGGAN